MLDDMAKSMVDVKERIVDDIVRRDGSPSPLSTVQEICNRDLPIGGSFFEASANIDNLRSILRMARSFKF